MVKDLEGGSDPPSLTSEGEAAFFNPELKMEKAFRVGQVQPVTGMASKAHNSQQMALWPHMKPEPDNATGGLSLG